jgi:uncharacterized protein YegL
MPYQTNMNNDYTHIAIVQDKSGSMHPLAKDTREGYNAFIEEHKKAPGKCTFTLMQFNTSFNLVHDFVDIQSVPPLNEDTYHPDGFTALLDALAHAIIAVGKRLESMPEAERPARVIFVVMTDGNENSSQEYGDQDGHKRVFDMVKHQTEVYNWQFIYIGANQDAIKTGCNYGFVASTSMSAAHNAKGLKSSLEAVAANTRKYRSSAPTETGTLCFSSEQRQAQYEAGATPDAFAKDTQ